MFTELVFFCSRGKYIAKKDGNAFNNLFSLTSTCSHFHFKWPPDVSFQLCMINGTDCAFGVSHILEQSGYLTIL